MLMALDRHNMPGSVDAVQDRINSLAIQLNAEQKKIGETEGSIGVRIGDLLDSIDSMVQEQSAASIKSLSNIETVISEDTIAMRKGYAEELKAINEATEAHLVEAADRLHGLQAALQKESQDFGRCCDRLETDLGRKVQELAHEVEVDRMVRSKTTNRIRDIIQSTNDELENEFKHESANQKHMRDNMKKLIHSIRGRLDGIE